MTNEYYRYGMMETIFLPIDIHKETTLESEKEDDIELFYDHLIKSMLT
jgi:hypothetical protein